MNFPREFERNPSQSRCATQPALSATSLPCRGPAKEVNERAVVIPIAIDTHLRIFPFMAAKMRRLAAKCTKNRTDTWVMIRVSNLLYVHYPFSTHHLADRPRPVLALFSKCEDGPG